ncbi:MAG TPA: hypothetical protein VIS10_07730 [Anaerolineales bacterium]
MTYQGGSTLPPDLLERLAIEGFESKTVKTCLRRLRLRFSNLAKVASIVRVKAPDCPTAETYLANCPVFDVYLHRALGQAGEHGAGRRVGDAPVAGAIVANGIDVTLVPRARLLVFAGESQLAAVGPPGEILWRP